MLNHRVLHKRFDHDIFRGNESSTSRRVTVDSHVLFGFEGIDVVNRILLTRCDINPTAVIGREASLFRRALAWILNCCQDLGIG
jgi:hypothetical protein